MFGELLLVEDPCDESEEADDQGAENICARPWMTVSTGLESDQEERQANDGQGTANPVNALQDVEGGQTLSTNVCDGEVCEREAACSDTIVDKRDPHSPSPGVAGGKQLAVEDIGGEWEDEGSQGSRDITTVLDWDSLVQTAAAISVGPIWM